METDIYRQCFTHYGVGFLIANYMEALTYDYGLSVLNLLKQSPLAIVATVVIIINYSSSGAHGASGY